MNEYIDDAKKFLRWSNHFRGQINSEDERLQAVLFLAFAVERLLKGIIFSVNPTYVLSSPQFADSVAVLYRDRMRFTSKEDRTVNHNAAEHVITFRESLERARVFSPATKDLWATLQRLGTMRDIIAHNRLKLLKASSISQVLLRDFPKIVDGYARELGIPQDDLLGEVLSPDVVPEPGYEWLLQALKDPNTLDPVYEIFKGATTASEIEARNAMAIRADAIAKSGGVSGRVTCPSCSKEAILEGEVDYGCCDDEGDSYPEGVSTHAFRCFHCGLGIGDPLLLDELDFSTRLDHRWSPRTENSEASDIKND